MPKAGEVYRHFKGNLYKVICEARHSETEEKMVVYQALYGDYQIYVRPFSSFISAVDYNKYPDATQSMRFELVSPVVDVAAVQPVEKMANDTTVTDDKACKEAEVKEKEQTVVSESLTDTESTKVTDYQSQETRWEDTVELNPLVEAFLDADTLDERRNLLVSAQNKLTQDDITIMATVMDIEIDSELDIMTRYQQLMTCLDTKSRFETLRLR